MWRMMTLEKLDVVEAPDWTLGVVDFLGKVLDSRDMCHYSDEGQILTTTIDNKNNSTRVLYKNEVISDTSTVLESLSSSRTKQR